MKKSLEDLRKEVQQHEAARILEKYGIPTLETVERNHILQVLELVKWNVRKASMILGIDRTTLYRKLRHFGIQRKGRAA